MLKGKIETRTWGTPYRGLVLICASQKSYDYRQMRDIAGHIQHDRITMFGELPNYIAGHAIAIGELVDCRFMKQEDESDTFVKYLEPWTESGHKNTIIRRLYCHVYKDVHPIKPFIFKGKQGWSWLTEEQKALIELI